MSVPTDAPKPTRDDAIGDVAIPVTDGLNRFAGDTTEGWDPVRFGIALVRALRKDKRTATRPSVRMSIAVPRFLTARYFRLGTLCANDYLDAARLNSAPEDQALATEIARGLLFPDVEERKARAAKAAAQAEQSSSSAAGPVGRGKKEKPTVSAADVTAGILGDLASLDLDLDAMDSLDLDTLDAMLDDDDSDEGDAAGDEDAFALFERLYSSADLAERALAELVSSFGGPAELHGIGADTVARVRGFVSASLLSAVGQLSPMQIAHGCAAGFGADLLQACAVPWELAGALAGAADPPALTAHLADVGAGNHHTDHRTVGLVARYLQPHVKQAKSESSVSRHGTIAHTVVDDLITDAMSRAHDLFDVAELLIHAEVWRDLDDALLQRSVAEHPLRALEAGRRLEARFGHPLEVPLFVRWRASLAEDPSLLDLTVIHVDDDAWEQEARLAMARLLADLEAKQAAADLLRAERDEAEGGATEEADDAVDFDDEAGPGDVRAATPEEVASLGQKTSAYQTVPEVQEVQGLIAVAEALGRTGMTRGAKLATELVTEALCLVRDGDLFLPFLDDFLARSLIPHDLERVIAAGQALGVDPNEIYDRLGDALEQLRAMVLGGSHEVDRYKRLVDACRYIPDDLMRELCEAAGAGGDDGGGNLEAIAALLAINLGSASAHLKDEQVLQGLGYKGIGGGPNLLKQWFTHRKTVRDGLREKIKAQVKDALLDVAFQWLGGGDGETGKGLIPQQQSRPYVAGDDLDALDLESTMDTIISLGKPLDRVTLDDLYVHDVSKGQAALSVLIDISGSMGGGELAMCAVAVVMLLGKVKPSEIALAVFESNTHVIKTFEDESDLDVVADKVLDLEATGGTRVDAALTWARDQLGSVDEAAFRLLFLLSDFMFFERPDEIERHSRGIGDLGTVLLAASHGHLDEKTAGLMVQTIGGQHVRLKSLEALPTILAETLRQIGDGAFSG